MNDITSTFEDITPELAAEYLLANRQNRPVKEKTVEMFARDMMAGNWRLTHQGIAFYDNGDLFDGQHRLLGVVKSGATVKMMVTRGIPAEIGGKKTMDAVDSGVPRSVADQLRLSHEMKGRVNQLVAVCARIAGIVFGPGVRKLSTPQCVDMQPLYNAHIQAVLEAMATAPLKVLTHAGVLGGLAFARAGYPEETDRFMKILASHEHDLGSKIGQRHPAAELREAISACDKPYSLKERKVESERTMAACRAFIDGKSVFDLGVSDGTDAASDDMAFFSAKQVDLIDGMRRIFFAEPLKKKALMGLSVTKPVEADGVTIEPGHQATVIRARITADMERRDRLVEKWTRAMNNGDRVERMDIEKELAEVNRRLRECGELLRHGSYLCGASKEERVA